MKLDKIRKALAQQLGLLPKEDTTKNKLTETINNSLTGKHNLTKEQYNKIGDNIWEAINKEKTELKMITPRKTIFSRIAAVASIVLIAGILLIQQAKSPSEINIASVKGEVHFKNKGKTLKTGFALTTKNNAEVKINLIAAGKLQFKGPGALKLTKSAKKDGQPSQKWRLTAGKVAIKLQKRSYANFTLTTPHALIEVTGTAFSVEVTKTKTTLSVQEGQVNFQPINKPAEKVNAGENREIKENDTKPTKQITPKNKKAKKITKLTEKIKLKNGTTLTGRIISQTKNEVKIITKGGTLKIPTTAIKSINVIKKVK